MIVTLSVAIFFSAVSSAVWRERKYRRWLHQNETEMSFSRDGGNDFFVANSNVLRLAFSDRVVDDQFILKLQRIKSIGNLSFSGCEFTSDAVFSKLVLERTIHLSINDCDIHAGLFPKDCYVRYMSIGRCEESKTRRILESINGGTLTYVYDGPRCSWIGEVRTFELILARQRRDKKWESFRNDLDRPVR